MGIRSCNGICERLAVQGRIYLKSYDVEAGRKACRVCTKIFEKETGNRCPCCKNKLSNSITQGAKSPERERRHALLGHTRIA